MSRYLGSIAVILGLAALPLAMHAEEESMEIIEDAHEVLTLPDDAADEARENAAFGLETANEARADGRAFGERRAEAARQHRGEAGLETAAEASGNAPPDLPRDAGRPE